MLEKEKKNARLFGAIPAAGFDSNAARAIPQAPEPARALPDEAQAPRTNTIPRRRLKISPVTAIGMLVLALLLVMLVNGFVQYYEATSRVGELQTQLAEENEIISKLRSKYESQIDLKQIEMKAKELGMRQPLQKQTVYINVSGADHTEVLAVDDRGFLARAWDAICEGVDDILEYFKR